MRDDEVKKLAKLRTHIIEFYVRLDEKHSPTSVMNTRDTSILCEQVIASIDDLIREYVEFKK
jgi:hypothetical protein